MEPTYLYIKQHSITGLLYFGKSSRLEHLMLKYLGSGIRWSPHIKKHGINHVETIWYCLFHDEATISEFALMFSEQQDIVKSNLWANLKPENGLDGGGVKGCTFKNRKSRGPHSTETKIKQSIALLGIAKSEVDKQKMRKPKGPMSEEGKRIRSLSGIGKHFGVKSEEQKIKISLALKGKKKVGQIKVICPHCSKEGVLNGMKRYHFDNCN